MKQPSLTRKEKTRRNLLLLWAIPPVCELPGVAIAISVFPEMAADAVFGSVGSQALAYLGAVLAAAGLVVGRSRSAAMGLRRVLAMLLCIDSGLLGVLMLGFLNGSASGIFGIILAHCVVAGLAIATLLMQRPVSAQPSQPGS